MTVREIAEKFTLLSDLVYPFEISSAEDTIDFIHFTENDLDCGGSKTIKTLREIIDENDDDDLIVERATELIDQIQKRGTH